MFFRVYKNGREIWNYGVLILRIEKHEIKGKHGNTKSLESFKEKFYWRRARIKGNSASTGISGLILIRLMRFPF